MKPKLLVSVRDAKEAWLVSRYEIGIVDAKEPDAGPLGKVADPVLRELLEVISPGQCRSLALGELYSLTDQGWDEELVARFHYAKIGLAGAVDRRDWQAELRQVLSWLPAEVARVLVAYVDYPGCRAPGIERVVSTAAQSGCAAVLLDTCDKTAGDVFGHVDIHQLRQIVNQIQSFGMRAVVAGSVSERTLAAVVDCQPDFVGVRGAVCPGGRGAAIGQAELGRFVNLLSKLSGGQSTSPTRLGADLD